MSITLELAQGGKKVGHVCSRDYRRGNNCPLILRTTSEDILTANVFGILRRLCPSLWLRPLLNAAFRTKRFSWADMTNPQVRFWVPVRPPSNRAGIEGNSEVDALIEFGKTVVFIESKYRAPLSKGTKHDPTRDQLVRLLDVAYSSIVTEDFFPRVPYVIVMGVWPKEPVLVTKYRDSKEVASALGHHSRFPEHEEMSQILSKRVGYVSWSGLQSILTKACTTASHTEQGFLVDVINYIDHRVRAVRPALTSHRQIDLPGTHQSQLPEGDTNDSETHFWEAYG